MIDFRSLCARMADELDYYRQLLMDDRRETHALAVEARAALAKPQPPTFLDAIRLAKGSHDYSGGYGGTPCDEAFHAGIGTVVNVLTKAATGPWDYQTIGVFEAGAPQPAADSEMSAGPAVQSREPDSVTTEPSDEELLELMPETMRDEFSYAARTCSNAMAGRVKPGIFRVCLNTAALEYARAVLARWGTPALQPIPVSERLPEAGDCDAEGRCWWWHPSHPESGYQEGWMLRPGDWGTGRYDSDDCLAHTHWLPAHALPLPSVEVE